MNKLAFWVLIFIGLMFCFFKYEVGSYIEIEQQYIRIMNFGLWVIGFTIIYYGTPNGFIRGLKNSKKKDKQG